MRKFLATAVATGVAVLPTSADAYMKGCNSHACEKRVFKKHMKKTVRPFRDWLRRVRTCENGGRYYNVRANGFLWAYQFHPNTWQAAGGAWPISYTPTPLEQDYRAVKWATKIGWSNVHSTAGWPVCG
jgi:hypothetical protein